MAKKRNEADAPWSVALLAGQIKAALTAGLPTRVRVLGEISNLSDRNHWFFSLKDEEACIRCVMFASAARKVGFAARDGMEVIATGRVDFFEGQGNVQLYVDRLEPVGQGAREAALRELVESLRDRGYFDPANKKALPAVPRRVAVVTSRGAAALQDVIHTAAKRWGGCELVLVDVRVQGSDAAPQIAAALRYLSARGAEHRIDAILLTRGGGSIEDLWAFNEVEVADAIFRCRLPIVAAIGHETDTTLAELVADLRCATPTQAAMVLIPDRETLLQQITQLSSRLDLILRRQCERGRHRLHLIARHALFQRPARLVDDARQRLDRDQVQLEQALPRQLTHARQRLEALRRTLDAVSPANVLCRGYSYTLAPDGHVLRSAADARPGQVLTTVLADGRVRSVIDGEPGQTLTNAPTPPTRRKRKASTSAGASLFE